MKRTSVLTAAVVLLLFQGPAAAKNMEDLYFEKNTKVRLSQREFEALKKIKKWKSGDRKGMKPTVGSNGTLKYIYGLAQPVISCAVLQVTDIAMEPGERINSIHLGDKARWQIEPATTGSGEDAIQHMIVKPIDTDLNTSLVVTTNRRTYHMVLKSYKDKYMPKISFVYPDAIMAKFNAHTRAKESERQEKIIAETGQSIDELFFNYKVDGESRWIPVRVYNNGVKTVIQMPREMENNEAPSLLVIRPNGSFDSEKDQVMVNYRIHDDKYIVDQVFDKAILIAGVGSGQDKVTIERIKEK